MSSEPQNLAAVLEAPGTPFKIINRSIPTPGLHELVVRNYAIAANPADWKLQLMTNSFLKSFPTVLGSDGCGVVTAVGSNVTRFKVGDRVTGFGGVIYNSDINHGSWQTYTVLKGSATTKIPDFMSFEEGSVFPMAMATAAITLFACLGISRSVDSKPRSGLLIWGASSSVGISTLQVAKDLGFKVFATASPAHHELLKSLGAYEVFDYRDSSVTDKIIQAAKSAGVTISLGLDAITENNTSESSVEVLLASGGKGGKLILVNPWPGKDEPDGLEISMTIAGRIGMDQVELSRWFFNEYLENALETKSIVPAPKIEIITGGIQSTQSVLDRLKAGVSGKKLVVQVE